MAWTLLCHPSRKTLRPLIELYGPNRARMKAEVEILERQLKHRLVKFRAPDDATVRKAICKNEKRVLAVYLHVRSGYGASAIGPTILQYHRLLSGNETRLHLS